MKKSESMEIQGILNLILVKLKEIDSRLDKIESRLDRLEDRMDKLEEDMNKKFLFLNNRIDQLEESMDEKFEGVYTILNTKLLDLNGRVVSAGKQLVG